MMTMLLLILALTSLPSEATANACHGVWVESTEAHGAADRAGLQPGDRLLRWQRSANPPANPEAATGDFCSPFDVDMVEIEQSPRGSVTLSIRRGDEELHVALQPGKWQMSVRPGLEGEELHSYQDAVRAGTADLDQSLAVLEQLQNQALAREDTLLAVWYAARAGKLALAGERRAEAETRCRAALELLESSEGYDPVRCLILIECGRANIWQYRFADAEVYFVQAAALALELRGESFLLSQALFEQGFTRWRRGEINDAESILTEVIEMQERLAPGCIEQALALDYLAFSVMQKGAVDEALEHARHGLKLREREAPGSVLVARSLVNIGRLALQADRLKEAERSLSRATAMLGRLAFDSVYHIDALSTLGQLAFRQGELERAARVLRLALEIRTRLTPDSYGVAFLLDLLSQVENERGRLAEAESLSWRSLQFKRRLQASSKMIIVTLNTLGLIAHERGNLALADEYYRRAQDLITEETPDSPELATLLLNRGQVAEERGDFTGARDGYLAALAINEARDPDGLEVALDLTSLGWLEVKEERLDEAETHLNRARSIRERLAPGGAELAITLQYLGDVALRRSDFQEAERLLEQSLEIRSRLLPNSMLESYSLRELGVVALRQGKTETAEQLFYQALERRRRLAPGSFRLAEVLHDLAMVARQSGKVERALSFFSDAIEVIETQHGRVGGSQLSHATFRAQFEGCYQDYLQLLLDTGMKEEAFHVLERSRARGVLALLTERDLVYASELAPELEQERRMHAAQYDRTLAELAGCSPMEEGDRIGLLRRKLRELRRRQEEIDEEVRRSDPRLAALQYPDVLDLEGVRRSLDPGTVLLSYALIRERPYLFVVSRDPKQPLVVLELETTTTQLETDVQFLRAAIASARASRSSGTSVLRRAHKLYQILIMPAEPWVEKADRLLLCPDGVLHTLPFAALLRSLNLEGEDGPPRYLIAWKPLYTVVSATVAAQLRQQREEGRARTRVVAFGDPVYPPSQISLEEGQPAINKATLSPLPATRREVQQVAEVWGDDAVVHLGAEAGERAVKELNGEYRVLHFACHGLLEMRSPLDSALVLSIPKNPDPGWDNGYLQAWEIFEQLRFDADLVVLSACGTALGTYLAGEGLIGLTRAFQYAGARSVVATLWAVSDDSTAGLMRLFHNGLHDGMSTAEALRQAQLGLMTGTIEVPNAKGGVSRIDASASFAWSGFTVIGDWH